MASFRVVWTPSPLAAGEKIRIRATKQLSPGTGFVSRRQYRDVYLGNPASVSNVQIVANYTAKFGALLSGSKIFLMLSVISPAGAESLPVETTTIVA